MGRKIIVLSDGTGNSAGKLFRTNVWRIYQALDLSDVDQIARYDDGVGTSKFKPLAILGGAVGWGLKRNVIDLYSFLCRNCDSSDQIYGFGFSRGAFTIRVLMKFVLSEGLVCEFSSQDDLHTKARFLYRRFRRNRKTRFRIEVAGRLVRDCAILLWNILIHSAIPKAPKTSPVDSIKFIGVWDTVDAYGLPINELKQGIDRYLWPLALEDRTLDRRIEKACHALSIDDKRQTFHPLLWDESNESKHPVATHTVAERLTQLWFAGVHSNLGGGYPDDSLSYVSLSWMIQEAQMRGLRFDPSSLGQINSIRSPYGRIYDSRSGFGSYYRYGPRRLEPPVDNQGAVIPRPKIHSSVLWRMAYGSDAYAPLSLPSELRIVGEASDQPIRVDSHNTKTQPEQNIFSFEEYSEFMRNCTEVLTRTDPEAATRSSLSKPSNETLNLIWDTVWWRQIIYFLTLAVTLCLIAFPFLPTLQFWSTVILLPLRSLLLFVPHSLQPSTFTHMTDPFVSAVTGVANALLPRFTKPWIDAFSNHPSSFSSYLLALVACLSLGSLIDRRIQDRALAAWNQKWRSVRQLWSKDSARPRIVAALLASGLLFYNIQEFLSATVHPTECYAATHSYIKCLPTAIREALTNDFLGLNVLFGTYLAILVVGILILLLWMRYKTISRSTVSAQVNEVPGFFLWLARSTRTNGTFVKIHTALVRRAIPLAFAISLLLFILCISNLISFEILDSAGSFCATPVQSAAGQGPVGGNDGQNVDSDSAKPEPIVIEHDLSAFCNLTSAKLDAFTPYEVVIDYWNDPTDIGRSWFTPPLSAPYVPVALRKIIRPFIAIPLRRRIAAPWHIMIVRDGQLGGQETLLDHRSTIVTAGSNGELYFYVNEPVIALPYVYNWFYRNLKGSAQITLTKKLDDPPSAE